LGKDSKDYLYFGTYGADASIQGVYQLEHDGTGGLSEIGFSAQGDRTYGMADSGNDDKVFFMLRGEKYNASVITLP